MITETINTPSTIFYTTRNENLCDPLACPIRELSGLVRQGSPSYQELYAYCREKGFQEPADHINTVTELSSALGPSGIFSADCPNADTSFEPGLTCGNVVGVDQSRFSATGRLLRFLSDNSRPEGDQNG
jgi:hypothetical protein